MNYRLQWCVRCQDFHRPPQPQNHKMFHTDPFATRYIPEIPGRLCRHCGWPIEYDRAWGGWYHDGWFKTKECGYITRSTHAEPVGNMYMATLRYRRALDAYRKAQASQVT